MSRNPFPTSAPSSRGLRRDDVGLPTGDRYGRDPVANDPRLVAKRVQQVEAERDLVVEEVTTGFCGAVLGLEKGPGGEVVLLEDRHGTVRRFPLLVAGFSWEGRTVTLVKPAPKGATGLLRSASGSVAVTDHRARVARAGRIYVEGVHDAALVEMVWGHDLRVEGVVVEPLHGVDDLAGVVAQFRPHAGARLGVLVDHLVAGSKESRIAASVGGDPHVLVTGHPYVDVWQAVKPATVGIRAWPDVPRGEDWKTGVCRRLGWGDEPGEAFATRVLPRVSSWADLEVGLLGAMERLIDFVVQ